VKQISREREQTRIELQAKLENSMDALKLVPDIPSPPLPQGIDDVSIIDNVRDCTEKNIRVVTLAIESDHRLLSSLREELNALLILETANKHDVERMETLMKAVRTLEVDKKRKSAKYDGDAAIDQLKKDLSRIVANREYTTLSRRYAEDVKRLDSMRISEIADRQAKIEDMTSSLWPTMSSSECRNLINVKRTRLETKATFLRTQAELEKLQLEDYDKNISAKTHVVDELKRTIFNKEETVRKFEIVDNCPVCDTLLSISGDKLSVSTPEASAMRSLSKESIRRDILVHRKALEREQKALDSFQRTASMAAALKSRLDQIDRDVLSETEDSLADLESYMNTNLQLSVRLQEQKDATYSATFLELERSIALDFKKLNKLQFANREDGESCNLTEENLRDKIEEQERIARDLADIDRRLQTAREDCAVIDSKVNNRCSLHTLKFRCVRSSDAVLELVDTVEERARSNQNKKEADTRLLMEIDSFKNAQDKFNSRVECAKKVSELEADLVTAIARESSINALKLKILEAESLAITTLIETINLHAQVYLDQFFVDDPISVRVRSFKEKKAGSSKPQINIDVLYKGMESDLGSISGGECARVVLAFTLALGEMFSSPLLLLDECTANLNQELATVVFNAVRENYKGKLALIVAHQVITGIFDRRIDLTT
jgi:hypothetical protein